MKKAVTVLLCILLICGTTVAITYLVMRPLITAFAWPQKVASAVKDLFQTHVTVNSSSVSLEAEQIAELALVQRKTLCYTKYEKWFAGGYAVAVVRGEYVAKVGYDLKHTVINFDQATRVVKIKLPPAHLLSFETISHSNFYLQDDPRCRLTPDDIARDYSENTDSARREAVEHGITSEAELRMQERIKDIFRGIADTVILNGDTIQVPDARTL